MHRLYRPRLLLFGVLALFELFQQTNATASSNVKQGKVFLQKQLPLRLIMTTPTGLAGNVATTPVSGRQALQAVFSRPVIALGSDFGQPSAQLKFPFSLSCPVPGKSRWVTTSIARFDPDVDWPSDLDCELVWNKGMTSYDGTPLVLGETAPRRALTTAPLSMWLLDVVSETAANLTDGLWIANVDGTFEVPPDGKILLSFSYPVNLRMLQSALKVVEASQPGGPSLAYDVGPCQSPSRWPVYYTNGAGSSSSSEGLSLDVNTTCAQVTPTSRLKPGTSYQLVLHRGARYHPLAGPLQSALEAAVVGLRPFKLPFVDSYSGSVEYGARFRRLDLWLPHGLSRDTPLEALAARISLCQLAAAGSRSGGGCQTTPFALSLLSRGKARLDVPTLRPRTQYRISVSGDPRVKDGFGQGLQAANVTFWTAGVSFAFAPPYLDSAVAVLELGADNLTSWPFVTRGVGPDRFYGDVPIAVRSWELALGSGRVQVLLAKAMRQYGYTTGELTSWFGAPTVALTVPSEFQSRSTDAPDWTQLLLPLVDRAVPARARLITTYVSTQSYSQYTKLLLNSSLSFNVVQSGQRLTAWLLDSAAGGRPVAGATVAVYYDTGYWNQPEPKLLGRCTTNADGLCTITYSLTDSWQLTAFAIAGDRFAVLAGNNFVPGPAGTADFVGSLVADRLVVVPGDSVKITGFVQRTTSDGLQLPASTYAALRVSPNWQASAAVSTPAASGGAVIRPATAFAGGRRSRQLLQSGSAAIAAAAALAVEDAAMVDQPRNAEIFLYDSDVHSSALPYGGASASVDISSAPSSFPVMINGSTGTLHAEIFIPEDVRLQSYTIQLSIPAPSGADTNTDRVAPAAGSAELMSWPVIPSAAVTITVADPRPPTADLKLVVPPWVLPNASVPLTATAVSYIGASVAGAALTATWRTARAAGLLTLTTDATGVAGGVIELGALPAANRSEPYDTLTIDVEWIGPTRERITRSVASTLADGPARLDLQMSLDPTTPGTAFALAATLTSNTDGSPLTGLPVRATLRPHPDDPSPTCTNRPACSLTSGAPFSPMCQLALPCVGRFLLEACADVPALAPAAPAVEDAAGAGAGSSPTTTTTTSRVCSQRTLGRNSSEWAARPLREHPEPRLFTDKTSYAVGEEVTLRLQNPWPGARLLLTWGNGPRSRSKVVFLVESGLAEVALGSLGDEAFGGGAIVAVLDVPRLAPEALPPRQLQLPRSSLFDPLAPHSHVLRAALEVRPDNALGVSVDVRAAAASDGAKGRSDPWVITDVDGKEVVAVEPGCEAEITVTVRNGLGDNAPAPAAGSVEVTVYGVDKAFLDLLPYDLPHPEQEMVLRLAADINAYGINAYRLAPGAVRAVYDKLMARLTGLDPWLPLDTTVRPNEWSAVDANDTTYLAGYGTALTVMPATHEYGYGAQYEIATAGATTSMSGAVAPNKGAGNTVQTASRAPVAASADSSSSSAGGVGSSSSTTSSSSSSTISVRYESDFIVTPLFATATTDEAGRARLTFTAPQNLGTFVLRAFAAAGATARYGSGQAKLAVRRRLSLTPSLPRFVRVGDSFQAGVLVTVGAAPATVRVQLQLGAPASRSAAAPLSLSGPASKTLRFPAGGGLQQEVRFALSAAAMGATNLTFTADDVSGPEGGAADALQTELQVMGQQGDVWVATSFALAALPPSDADGSIGAVQWQEGMALPAAVSGSGGLNLTAGVGYFPAISGTYDTLMPSYLDRSYIAAVPAMLWATLPAVLSYYGQPIDASRSAAAAGSFNDLATLTWGDYGLLWGSPSRWSGWQPQRTDLWLNTWALFLAAQAAPALRTNTPSGSPTRAADLPPSIAPFAVPWVALESDQLPVWRAAVARQLVADAVESRRRPYNPGPYSDWETLAWVRLVLGADWVPSDASDQIRADLSLSVLLRNNGSMSRKAQLLTALLLLQPQQQSLRSPNPSPRLLNTTLDELTSSLRVQGRTAYVAAGAGVAAAAPLEDQALSLLLLLRAGASHQLLPKLAAYVANPAPPGGYGLYPICSSLRDQGLAVAALTEYDRVRGSSKPDVVIRADVNGLAVLEASFKAGGSTRPVSNSTAWEQLPPPPLSGTSELNFGVSGRGEVTVAASLHFVPAELLPFPTYRGLFVEAALQAVDPATGRPTGRPLAAVPLGSVVALSLQLTSPDDLGPVTLTVLMPGGLEPIDPNLDGSSVDPRTGARGDLGLNCGANWVDGASWTSAAVRWRWWWPVCPSQETRPHVVTFSYLSLRSGTSSVTLRAVAATPGDFVFPPVRASADSQPELMGMTAASRIAVCADCVKPTYAARSALPVACPNDCSGRGFCNLKTGRCRCDPRFGRADCSRPVA